MAHGNQSGNFWQGEICAINVNLRAMWKTNRTEQGFGEIDPFLHAVQELLVP